LAIRVIIKYLESERARERERERERELELEAEGVCVTKKTNMQKYNF